MRLLSLAIPLLLGGFAAHAAVIDLSGTVTTSSGSPIKGAVVTITGENISDTTDNKGAFSIIEGKVALNAPKILPQYESIFLEKGVIGFSVAKSTPVRIDLYDMRGTLLKRVADKTIPSGSYRYNIMADPLATHMLAVRVTLGREHATFRYMPLQNGRQHVRLSSGETFSSTGSGLAQIKAAVDTLKVTAEGFTGKMVPLTSYETTVSVKLDSIPVLALDTFSFFVTSQRALTILSKSEKGFGGDFSFGFTGPGAGLKGADSICSCIAEMSMEGASAKKWRAFLSVKSDENGNQVNAIDRIGEGPWYDRLGRMVAPDIQGLLNTRPEGGHSAIRDDLPNEEGIPNHTPEGDGVKVDNHHIVTGSDTNGKLYTAGSTCDDWTSTTASGSPRCGFSWPRTMGGRGGGGGGASHWISGFNAGGCEAGVHTIDDGPGPRESIIGSGGGYGGFYCFALVP